MSDSPKDRKGSGSWFSDGWQLYSHLGVSSGIDDALTRRIILTNRVAAVVFVLGLGLTFYFLSGEYSSITLYWFTVLLGAVWLMPFLNLLGATGISRHILSSLMPLFIIGIVSHTRVATPDEVHGASYYIPRFYLMAISFFPLLLFSPKEKVRMYVSFGFNLLILLFYNELLDVFGAGMGVLEPAVEQAFFISVSSVISLVVIGAGFFFLNGLNNDYELRIKELLNETEQKNMRIQSAINYAHGIQQVVMPAKEMEDGMADRVFTFFRPRDVVSGDFYMLREEGPVTLFAVIDCTGHGVPGAFVSLLAFSALQRAILAHGLGSPAAIVSEANRLFYRDFSRSGNSDMRDGMDLILCSLHSETGMLRMAGANLSCHVVQQGRLHTYRGDRGAISIASPDRQFSETEVRLAVGDMFYMTTDGLQDQFGGPDDKRLGKRTIAARFAEISSLPFHAQRQAVQRLFEDWKGDREQLDDVCVMGVRV